MRVTLALLARLALLMCLTLRAPLLVSPALLPALARRAPLRTHAATLVTWVVLANAQGPH